MTESTIWRYDGEWTRIPDPIEWDGDDEPIEHRMTTAGFEVADRWGTLGEVDIWQHRSDERWRVHVSFDSSRIFEIEVAALPHLIKLLSEVAAIYTASQLSRVAESLESLIYNSAEDADRERKRRFCR